MKKAAQPGGVAFNQPVRVSRRDELAEPAARDRRRRLSGCKLVQAITRTRNAEAWITRCAGTHYLRMTNRQISLGGGAAGGEEGIEGVAVGGVAAFYGRVGPETAGFGVAVLLV